jgi:hypothetical protein
MNPEFAVLKISKSSLTAGDDGNSIDLSWHFQIFSSIGCRHHGFIECEWLSKPRENLPRDMKANSREMIHHP